MATRRAPWRAAAASTSLWVALAGCAASPTRDAMASEPDKQQEPAMAVPNSTYADVPLNSREPNACSPAQPPLPWLGIMIQAPTRVAFAAAKPQDGVVVPVCGFYRIDMAHLLDGKPLMLVAVNLASKKRHAGPMVDVETEPVLPDPQARPLDANAVKGLVSSSHFNPDLAHYVVLPAAAAVYEVHVEYGGMVSNSVQIAVVAR
jgi:hypothetical protein